MFFRSVNHRTKWAMASSSPTVKNYQKTISPMFGMVNPNVYPHEIIIFDGQSQCLMTMGL